MSRPPIDPKAVKAGKAAEKRIHLWLNRIGTEHQWVNHPREKKLPYDFIVGKKLVEVEHKSFEDYFRIAWGFGLDFLAHKVDHCSESTAYLMEMDDRFYVAPSMKWILDNKRKRHKKKTSRGTWEWFYNVNMPKNNMLDLEQVYDYDFRVEMDHGVSLSWKGYYRG
jgi:hypothetical protein